MAFSTQETRDQIRLAQIANEGFALIDHFYPAKANHHKRPPIYHRQPQPPFAPREDHQARLRKIGEDGFRVIDEVYGKQNRRNYQQAACVQYGTQAVTVQERAASSNVETARLYDANDTITGDGAAQIGGLMVNEYGKPKY